MSIVVAPAARKIMGSCSLFMNLAYGNQGLCNSFYSRAKAWPYKKHPAVLCKYTACPASLPAQGTYFTENLRILAYAKY
jgi:hypothetical protein